jgi:AraC-like DNA-binding protein
MEPVRGHGRWSDLVATPDTDAMTGQTDVTDWADGHDRAIRDLGQELASEAERYVSATWDMSSAERTAVTPSLPRRTRTPSGASAPDEFVAMAEAWDGQEPKRADMVKQAATQFGVSRRTVSRWLNAVTGAPMSEPSEE